MYTYHSFLIHSSADGHLGHLHVLVIVNSAAMNIVVHVSPFPSGFLSLYAQQWDCWVVWQFYFQFFKVFKKNYFELHGNDNPICETAKETQMCRTVFWTLGEREGDDLGEWH